MYIVWGGDLAPGYGWSVPVFRFLCPVVFDWFIILQKKNPGYSGVSKIARELHVFATARQGRAGQGRV